MKRCPKCGHDGGLGYCPICHSGNPPPLAGLFREPKLLGTCSIVDDGSPGAMERIERLRRMGWHVTVWRTRAPGPHA